MPRINTSNGDIELQFGKVADGTAMDDAVNVSQLAATAGGKANTDLGNVDSDLTAAEQLTLHNKIGGASDAGLFTSTVDEHDTGFDVLAVVLSAGQVTIANRYVTLRAGPVVFSPGAVDDPSAVTTTVNRTYFAGGNTIAFVDDATGIEVGDSLFIPETLAVPITDLEVGPSISKVVVGQTVTLDVDLDSKADLDLSNFDQPFVHTDEEIRYHFERDGQVTQLLPINPGNIGEFRANRIVNTDNTLRSISLNTVAGVPRDFGVYRVEMEIRSPLGSDTTILFGTDTTQQLLFSVLTDTPILAGANTLDILRVVTRDHLFGIVGYDKFDTVDAPDATFSSTVIAYDVVVFISQHLADQTDDQSDAQYQQNLEEDVFGASALDGTLNVPNFDIFYNQGVDSFIAPLTGDLTGSLLEYQPVQGRYIPTQTINLESVTTHALTAERLSVVGEANFGAQVRMADLEIHGNNGDSGTLQFFGALGESNGTDVSAIRTDVRSDADDDSLVTEAAVEQSLIHVEHDDRDYQQLGPAFMLQGAPNTSETWVFNLADQGEVDATIAQVLVPHVTGIAAAPPNLNPNQVEDALTDEAVIESIVDSSGGGIFSVTVTLKTPLTIVSAEARYVFTVHERLVRDLRPGTGITFGNDADGILEISAVTELIFVVGEDPPLFGDVLTPGGFSYRATPFGADLTMIRVTSLNTNGNLITSDNQALSLVVGDVITLDVFPDPVNVTISAIGALDGFGQQYTLAVALANNSPGDVLGLALDPVRTPISEISLRDNISGEVEGTKLIIDAVTGGGGGGGSDLDLTTGSTLDGGVQLTGDAADGNLLIVGNGTGTVQYSDVRTVLSTDAINLRISANNFFAGSEGITSSINVTGLSDGTVVTEYTYQGITLVFINDTKINGGLLQDIGSNLDGVWTTRTIAEITAGGIAQADSWNAFG